MRVYFYFLMCLVFVVTACGELNSDENSSQIDINVESVGELYTIEFPDSIFIDTRDGEEYELMFLNEKWWFVDNLNFESSNSYCFDDNEENCQKQGRLYLGTLVRDSMLCPIGFKVPSNEEWNSLLDFFSDTLNTEPEQNNVWVDLPTHLQTIGGGLGTIPFVKSYTGLYDPKQGYLQPTTISWWTSDAPPPVGLRGVVNSLDEPNVSMYFKNVAPIDARGIRCVSDF